MSGMVQVHTVYRSSSWQTTVDGLRQAPAAGTRAEAVAQGKRLAAELKARHFLHDVDGSVLESTDFSECQCASLTGPTYYLG
jgi:hypothetical protein